MAKLKDFPPAVRERARDRSLGLCEVWGMERATDHHHRRLRQRTGPGNTHGLANDLHIGHGVHMWMHNNPAKATQFGWIVPSGMDPAMVPVLWRGLWVLFADGGGVTRIDRPAMTRLELADAMKALEVA